MEDNKAINILDKSILLYHMALPALGSLGLIYKYKKLNISIVSSNNNYLENFKYLFAYIIILIFIAVYLGITNELIQKPKTIILGLMSLLAAPLAAFIEVVVQKQTNIFDYIFYISLIEFLGTTGTVVLLTFKKATKQNFKTIVNFFFAECILGLVFFFILKPVLVIDFADFTMAEIALLIGGIFISIYTYYNLVQTGKKYNERWQLILIGIMAWFLAIGVGILFL